LKTAFMALRCSGLPTLTVAITSSGEVSFKNWKAKRIDSHVDKRYVYTNQLNCVSYVFFLGGGAGVSELFCRSSSDYSFLVLHPVGWQASPCACNGLWLLSRMAEPPNFWEVQRNCAVRPNCYYAELPNFGSHDRKIDFSCTQALKLNLFERQLRIHKRSGSVVHFQIYKSFGRCCLRNGLL
jgi:hypothetical protein